MKNVIFGLVLAMISVSAMAADVDVNVGASSDYLYRGETVTAGEPAVFGSLKFNDVVVDNLFVSIDGVVLNTSPVNENKTLRTEFGVGYGLNFGSVAVDVGAYRVFNPVLYAEDYNELRTQATWQATDKFSVFGRVAHIVSDSVQNDSYVAVGAKYDGLFVNNLSVSLLASALRDDATADFSFNNVELTAEYQVLKGLYAFGTYSVGGATVKDAVDEVLTFRARDIPSVGMVGIRYQF